MKITWKIINEEIGRTKHATGIKCLVIGSNVIMNQNKVADSFNSYFLSIVNPKNTD